MFEIIDILAIKSLEKRINRKLDTEELLSIQEYGSVLIEINGAIEEHFFDKLSLDDLCSCSVDSQTLVEKDMVKQAKLDKKASLEQPKVPRARRIDSKQITQVFTPKPGVDRYLSQLQDIVHNDNELTEPERLLLELHIEGHTVRDISAILTSQFGRGFGRTTINKRLNTILKKNDLEPIFTKDLT